LNKLSLEVWADNENALIAYAKFVAVYPEKQLLLSFVFERMKERQKSIYSKYILIEIDFICKRRHTVINPQVQSYVTRFRKLMNINKIKIKSIWDCILQDDANNFKSLLIQTWLMLKDTKTFFRRVIRQYPNNFFLSNLYSQFLLQIFKNQNFYWTFVKIPNNSNPAKLNSASLSEFSLSRKSI
jgi:hypothetical protein